MKLIYYKIPPTPLFPFDFAQGRQRGGWRFLLFHTILAIASALLFSTNSFAGNSITIKHTAPSKYHISGIKKIDVAPFHYAMTYHEKGSKHIPQIIRHELEKDGYFDVAKKRDLKSLEMDEKLSISKLTQIGRRSGADAVITGEVTASQASMNPCSRTYLAEVSFCAELFNVRKRKITDRYCYSESGTKMIKGKGSYETRMVLGTAKSLAKKFVQALKPHEVTEKIALKKGKPCKAGLKLAKKGEWNEAIMKFNEVLMTDPDSPCALFNTGLANEALENYTEALNPYQKGGFKKAAKRIEKKIEEKKRLKNQMRKD